ncbi:MAG: hypothetical protein Q8Q69_00785 [Nitrosopumilaceae archaeon]|nr:hypothetical protein [Nitrosopumilaceae archaeon]
MLEQRSIRLFENAIKSEITRKGYRYQLDKFLEWSKIKDFDSLLEAPEKNIQELLEDYIMYLKKKVSPNTVPVYFAPIELFFTMNDVDTNYKKLRKLFPATEKSASGRAYTRQEIQKILRNAKTKRGRALVFLLASSGLRKGAIPGIKLKHMKKIDENSYSILIYEGSKQEDYVFTTPEATIPIDEYLDERRKDGEYMDGETPLFRNDYSLGIEKVKPCATDSISKLTGRLVSCIERKKITKRRYDVQQEYGFRKFFSTIIKNTMGITPTMTEKLINHIGVVQLDGNYFKPTVEQMFEAYKKAIPELTIEDSERYKVQNQKLQEQLSEKEKLENTVEELKLKFDRHEIKRNEQLSKQEKRIKELEDQIKSDRV